LTRKFQFYETSGVEEYYIYDPDTNELSGWLRNGDVLAAIPKMDGWTSPRLGIRFELGGTLVIRSPDGSPFLTAEELFQLRDRLTRERDKAEAERSLAVWEKEKAMAEKQKAMAEKERAISDKQAAESMMQKQADELAELKARLAALEKR
jgi:hypothetical protein